MKLHKEGTIFAWGSLILLLGAVLVTLLTGSLLTGIVSVLFLVWTAFVFYFFRDPVRSIRPDHNAIICPADGKVVVVEKVFEPEYFKEERWQISIFMSPLDVHINRIPITGEILHYQYHPGKYLVAWHPKSSTLNERNTIIIGQENGNQILVRQIAGAMARRIICYLQPGMKVSQGAELGFIRFGSRVDVFLPLDAEITVTPGQIVRGNVDVLARWNKM